MKFTEKKSRWLPVAIVAGVIILDLLIVILSHPKVPESPMLELARQELVEEP